MNKTRDLWIDLSKCIGIIMVVWAHALPKEYFVWRYINQFHMPLFFCISGYLYSCKDHWNIFLKKKVISLWLPYVMCACLMIAIVIVFKRIINVQIASISFKGIILIILLLETAPLQGATWFISVLFFSIIIYDAMYRIIMLISQNEKKVCIFLTILAIVALVVGTNTSLKYRGSVILNAIAFIHLGQIIKKANFLYKAPAWLGGIFVFLVGIITKYNTTSFVSNSYTSTTLFLSSSILGTLGVLLLCKKTCDIDMKLNEGRTFKMLYFIGKNTMGIVIWHFVAFKIVMLVQCLIYKLPFNRCLEFPVIYEYAFSGWIAFDILIGVYGSILIYGLLKKILIRFGNMSMRVKYLCKLLVG